MNEKALLHGFNMYEKKLMELMGEEEFAAFSRKVAKEMFRIELDGMAPGEFKDFCIDNFGMITMEDEHNG